MKITFYFSLFAFERMPETNDLPLIVAHRGASALAPENTLAAFRRALADGAEGVEFDVRLAKDGVPVVVHDANLRRVSRERGRVADYTSGELQQIDVGSWFNRFSPKNANADFSAEIVSTLDCILNFLGDFKGLIYVELKCRRAEIEPLARAVCAAIEKSAVLPQIIVKSFQLEVVPIVRRLCPEAKTAALFAPKIMTILRKEKRLVNIAHEIKADQISVHYSLATRKLVKKAEKRNLPVTIWTADNPLWVQRAIKSGITAIITNNPARLLKKKEEILRR